MYIANTVLYGLGMAGVLIIVWMGWLRTRRFGYLVLAAWALACILGTAVQSLVLPVIQLRFGANTNVQIFMWWFPTLSLMVTMVVLLLGLSMLVFRERTPGAPSDG